MCTTEEAPTNVSRRLLAKRQKCFLWLLDPIKRWPALPVLRFGKFDGVGHRVESMANVEALDALPLAIGQAAQVD